MSQLTFGESFGDKPVKTIGKDSKASSSSWYKGRTLSHSSVSTYQQCPQKWKFRYIDKIPEKPRSYFSFGKSVHSGLEFLFSKAKESVPSLQELLDYYKAHWLTEGYDTPNQERWFFKEGERILRGFYVKHKKEFSDVLQVELKFTIDVEGVPVTGFIDRIDLTPAGKISIIDYKTGKSFDKSRVRQDPQLTLYQIACRQVLNRDIEKLTLYHLNSLTPISTAPHSTALQEDVKKNIVDAGMGISKKAFDPKPDASGHCRWCDYVQVCPAFAGKKLPLSLQGSRSALSKDDIDRFGKLNERLTQLSKEKAELGKEIATHLKQNGTKELTGEYYRVKLDPDSDSEFQLKSELRDLEDT